MLDVFRNPILYGGGEGLCSNINRLGRKGRNHVFNISTSTVAWPPCFSFNYLSSLDAEKMPHPADHLSDTCSLCISTRSGVSVIT
jgi:hypothetical protein